MRLAAALLLLLAAGPARAEDDIRVEVSSLALHGKSKPAIEVFANKPVASVVVHLTRGDGQKTVLRSGAIPAGSKKSLPIDAPPGTSHYNGTLSVVFVDGSSGEMPVAMDLDVRKALEIEVPADRLDLKNAKLDVRMSGAADKCQYLVSFDGKPDRDGWARFDGEPAGTWLTVAWTPHGDDDVVLRIRLTCYDKLSFNRGVELYPWKLAIPHEEVVFETGKWDVLAGEQGKLTESLAKITEAIRRYGTVVPIKLYVMGHTDTVGDAASNRTLSRSRARAIAAWFKKSGVKVPVIYAGFGEDFPAVETGDDTDEIRNRRADYVLSNEPPSKAGWDPL